MGPVRRKRSQAPQSVGPVMLPFLHAVRPLRQLTIPTHTTTGTLPYFHPPLSSAQLCASLQQLGKSVSDIKEQQTFRTSFMTADLMRPFHLLSFEASEKSVCSSSSVARGAPESRIGTFRQLCMGAVMTDLHLLFSFIRFALLHHKGSMTS